MSERTFVIKDKHFSLAGDELKVGDKAPDFTVILPDFSNKKFSEYQGKVCVIASVPS